MPFPETVPVKTLDATNNEYDEETLGLYWALYVGGSTFNEWIDKIIIKREIERRGESIGVRSYEERKKFAYYQNLLGGFIDGSVAQITKDGVAIVVDGPEGTEERQQYYKDLNADVDGRGTPFASLSRSLLVDEMVSRYGWINVRQSDEDAQKMYIERVNPLKVIDWQVDLEAGRLIYAKARRQIEYRPNVWEPSDLYKVQWFLFSDDEIATYEALTNGRFYVDENGEKVDTAQLISTNDTSFGLQVYAVMAKRAQWVVDRVADTVKLLFNKQLDLSFALAEAAYPQLVLKVENRNNVEGIIKSELNMIVLEEGDNIEYLKVDPNTFTPLQGNIESLKTSVHETIQTMSRDTASIPQAGRMSGETVREMRSPLDALMSSFAWPVYETLMQALEDIKKFRGDEEITIDIIGLVDKNMIQMEQNDTERGEDAGEGRRDNGIDGRTDEESNEEEGPETEG